MNERQKKALDLYLFYKGKITAKEMAEKMQVSERTIKNWKSKFCWEKQLKEYKTNKKTRQRIKDVVETIEKIEETAPFDRNFKKKGKKGSDIFEQYTEFFNDDVMEIINYVKENEIIDMLWEQILLQYATIIRLNKIMYVKDRDDHLQVLKKNKTNEYGEESEYAIKFATDIFTDFQNAQSKALGTLIALIKLYKELINELSDLKKQEYELKIKRIEQEVAKSSNDDEEKDNELMKMLEGIKEGLNNEL